MGMPSFPAFALTMDPAKTMLGRDVPSWMLRPARRVDCATVIKMTDYAVLEVPAGSVIQHVSAYDVEVRESGGPSYIARVKV